MAFKKVQAKFTPMAGGKQIKGLTVITLDGLKVNSLYSKDSGPVLKNREGTLTIDIAGQTTTLSWATGPDRKLKNPGKFKDYVLFVGQPKDGLAGCTVNFLETDKVEFQKFAGKIKKFTGIVKNVLGLVSGVGMIASAAAGFVDSLLTFIGKQVDDDVELSFHGSLARPTAKPVLFPGSWAIWRKQKKLSDPSDIEIALKVREIKVPASQTRVVTTKTLTDEIGPGDYATVKTGTLNWKSGQATTVRGEVRHELKTVTRKARLVLESLELGQVSWNGIEDAGKKYITFDAAVGGGSDTQEISFEHKVRNGRAWVHDILGVGGQVLFDGPYTGGVPFAASMAVLRKGTLEGLEEFVEAAGEFASAIKKKQGATDEQVEGFEGRYENVTKAMLSLRGLALEFVPTKTSIGAKSYVLAEAPKKAASPPTQKEGIYYVVGPVGVWTKFDIVLQSQALGTATLKMKVLRYA